MHKSDQHFRQPKCSSGIQTNFSLECQSWQTENSYGFAKKEKYVPARNLTRIWSESLSISAQELAMIRSSSSWVEGNSNLFLVFHQEVSNHSVYNVYSEQNLSKKITANFGSAWQIEKCLQLGLMCTEDQNSKQRKGNRKNTMTNFQSFSRELIHRNFSVNSCSHFLLPLSSPSFIRPYAPKAVAVW